MSCIFYLGIYQLSKNCLSPLITIRIVHIFAAYRYHFRPFIAVHSWWLLHTSACLTYVTYAIACMCKISRSIYISFFHCIYLHHQPWETSHQFPVCLDPDQHSSLGFPRLLNYFVSHLHQLLAYTLYTWENIRDVNLSDVRYVCSTLLTVGPPKFVH